MAQVFGLRFAIRSGAGLKWTCKLVCKVVYTLSPSASQSDALQQIEGNLRRASYASYVCKVMNFLEIHRSIRIEEKLKKNAKGGRFHR